MKAESDVVAASHKYANAAKSATLHLFPQDTGVSKLVSNKELQRLYRQLTDPGTPGRAVYDRWLNDTPVCPLCGQGEPKTLDHHLPKSRFPVLAVTPLNLIPACRDCQSEKMEKYPSTAKEQTLHPYFDDPQTSVWLSAKVAQGTPPVITFTIVAPKTWTVLEQCRYERHLTVLALRRRYSLLAGRELPNIRFSLTGLHARGGRKAVELDLLERAESCRKIRLNSWQAAMFDACANSDWFCDGGFNNFV